MFSVYIHVHKNCIGRIWIGTMTKLSRALIICLKQRFSLFSFGDPLIFSSIFCIFTIQIIHFNECVILQLFFLSSTENWKNQKLALVLFSCRCQWLTSSSNFITVQQIPDVFSLPHSNCDPNCNINIARVKQTGEKMRYLSHEKNGKNVLKRREKRKKYRKNTGMRTSFTFFFSSSFFNSLNDSSFVSHLHEDFQASWWKANVLVMGYQDAPRWSHLVSLTWYTAKKPVSELLSSAITDWCCCNCGPQIAISELFLRVNLT